MSFCQQQPSCRPRHPKAAARPYDLMNRIGISIFVQSQTCRFVVVQLHCTDGRTLDGFPLRLLVN